MISEVHGPDSNAKPAPETPNLTGLFTAEEVAARLRLPLSTVYYLAKKGDLPSFRVGRSWRFRAEDLAGLQARVHRPWRVLVVDDDAVTRLLVRETMELMGCQVTESATVDEALPLARGQRFDLIFSDLKLPGRSGIELVRELQGRYPPRSLVVITAYPDLAVSTEILEHGPITILGKPFSARQLAGCLAQVTNTPPQESV